MTYLEEAKENFLKKEKDLSVYATPSSEAERLFPDEEDIRPPFYHDIDRIIHAYSYTRYLDKTQVYTRSTNDHISKRITHVQLVSKIARTIGRALNLNEDLIEAIALGHDIGHTPLGHAGEAMLNRISQREIGKYFAHNIQSVRHYMDVEKHGEGLNLTIQVLDGIMCHNGEILDSEYIPVEKDKEEFIREYEEAYVDLPNAKKYHPMTLEGCVVRISDIIAYIGRDIEDAIILGDIKREVIPKEITEVLGDNNKDIVNNITLDIIKNSMNKPYIKMSDEVYNALMQLKKFNYDNIYSKSMSQEDLDKYERGMNELYKDYLKAIENEDRTSLIYSIFLDTQKDRYLESTPKERQVIDFISGMTDELFITESEKILEKKRKM